MIKNKMNFNKSIWSFFDEIYCINLYSREDRYNICKKFFESYHIPVKFYRTHKHLVNGEQGCFESHINIIQKAYNNNSKNVLIFEDDIQITSEFTPQNVNKCIEFMKNNTWDIFNFGATPDIVHYTANKTNIEKIYRLHCYYAHCYAVNREYMSKILNYKYADIPIDLVYKCNRKTFTHLPIMISQSSNGSDIGKASFISDTDFIEFIRNSILKWYVLNINITAPSFIFYLIVSYILFHTYFDIDFGINILYGLFIIFFWFIYLYNKENYKCKILTKKNTLNKVKTCNIQ